MTSKVKVISQTVGVEGQSLKELVVYCARVSNSTSQIQGKYINRLWNYLKREKHWSPFEMADVTMEIETTRDISRQLLRHRSFQFQEFSQRYASPLADGLRLSFRETRLQDKQNRQNSLETEDEQLKRKWVGLQSKVKDVSLGAYITALESGIAKEVARVLLPEGMTRTRLYMKGSLRSWLHFIDVRADESSQKEIRQIAKECDKLLRELIGEENFDG
tara:strand:+ start:592 stop:1245 length:654 start_codon:yes stop_codon:yes gene_type:complete